MAYFNLSGLAQGFSKQATIVGSGHNMMTDIVFATYTVADAGCELLKKC